MGRSPTTRLRLDSECRVGVIPGEFAHLWVAHEPWVARRNQEGDPAGGAQRRLRWPELFGNHQPVELEIGFGKGMFLADQSSKRPDVNFVGIEWSWKFAAIAAHRLTARSLRNVRILSCDARQLFSAMDDGGLQAIHIYFPDPWWKRRHRKRRIIDSDNVAEFARLLREGGTLNLATDVSEYFDWMLRTIAAESRFAFINDDGSDRGIAREPATHFSRKYAAQGRPFYSAGYVRKAAEANLS